MIFLSHDVNLVLHIVFDSFSVLQMYSSKSKVPSSGVCSENYLALEFNLLLLWFDLHAAAADSSGVAWV